MNLFLSKLNVAKSWFELSFQINRHNVRPFRKALAWFNNLWIHLSSREFDWVFMSEIPSPHFQMESWASSQGELYIFVPEEILHCFFDFCLINIGIVFIWTMHQSLDKRIWFKILFFFFLFQRELHPVLCIDSCFLSCHLFRPTRVIQDRVTKMHPNYFNGKFWPYHLPCFINSIFNIGPAHKAWHF